MHTRLPQSKANSGFTLIELSIVLVIIGLIVGGVLVGQDLIKAAEIRATVSQIEKYDAAANTFRNKYNGLPGDLLNPTNFFTDMAGMQAGVSPDGDSLLEANAHATGLAAGFGSETALFWGQLARANLIADATTTIVSFASNAAIGTIGDGHMPQAKLGAGNRIHIGSNSGLNYYVILTMDGTTDVTVNTGAIDAQHGLTPNSAFQLDTKLDDGNPTTGRVISVAEDVAISAAGGGSASPNGAGVDDCYDSDASPTIYSTGLTTTMDAQECTLRIRTSF